MGARIVVLAAAMLGAVALAGCGMPGEKAAPGAVASTQPVQQGAAGVDQVLSVAHPGELVKLPQVDMDHLPAVDAVVTDGRGPQFLLSDNPETFPGDAIALQETVKPGAVRLYLYHCPDKSGAKKVITAVVENLGDRPMRLRFLRYAFPEVSKDYYRVGKMGLVRWFGREGANRPQIEVPAHGRRVLDEDLEMTQVSKDDLVHVFTDFTVDQPARVTVLQRSPQADSLKAVDELPKAPAAHGGAGRGLYPVSEREVAVRVDTARLPGAIVIADGKRDGWVRGKDGLAGGAEVMDKGNYGVIYRIRIRYRTSDGRGLALLISKPTSDNPLCKNACAAVVVSDGVERGGLVRLPSNRTTFGNPPEAVVIQRFAPVAAGQEQTAELFYSPPGACCLPTPLLLVPYKP